MATTFSHVALNCKDMGATERFYTKHFGFRRARVVAFDGTQIIFLKSGGVYLELFAAAGAAPGSAPEKDGPSYAGSFRHIAFQVDNVDQTLAAMGGDARVTLGPFNFDSFIPGWRTAWLSDPDGNIVEISQGFADQKDVPPAS
jgi:glyoxylase I family protein